jgi:hypothetical protein
MCQARAARTRCRLCFREHARGSACARRVSFHEKEDCVNGERRLGQPLLRARSIWRASVRVAGCRVPWCEDDDRRVIPVACGASRKISAPAAHGASAGREEFVRAAGTRLERIMIILNYCAVLVRAQVRRATLGAPPCTIGVGTMGPPLAGILGPASARTSGSQCTSVALCRLAKQLRMFHTALSMHSR